MTARSARMISGRHTWSGTASSHDGALASPARDSLSPTGTRGWRYLRHLMYTICLRSGTFKTLSTGDDRQSGAEKARSTQAGSSQTTPKMALVGAVDQRARTANRVPKALRAIPDEQSHQSGREMPWLSSRRSRPIQQARLRRSPSWTHEAITDVPLRGSDSAAPGHELPVGPTRVQLRYQA